ncbi:MAG: hypoxanthine phosphoribosyltransferase [Planctomycetota bacterium]|nr:MAG: hypoxanthine phosphoribosyltransferase [Planctomycetota bacterium]
MTSNETKSDPLAGATTLLDPVELHKAVSHVGRQINDYYGEKELTVVAVLHGAIVFTADLIRELRMPVRIETVTASSYHRDARRPGDLVVRMEEKQHLRGRHVLLVDDILDTGGTLSRLREEIAAFEPASLRIAVLLDKPSRREVDVHADFAGHEIPDLFVVGYGLDLDGRYRNLPQILALQPLESDDDASASDTAAENGAN